MKDKDVRNGGTLSFLLFFLRVNVIEKRYGVI